MSDLRQDDLGDGVVRLCLGRAPVNALSADFLMDFAEVLQNLDREAGVRAIVLASDFKVFSAGLDLKQAQDYDLAQQHAIVKGLNVGFLGLFDFPKPVVAAVNGAAIAGGLFFVLASDFRVGTPRARLGLAEVRVGADFPVGPMEIARDTLDPNALRRLMLTGQPITAEAALSAGIFDELVPDEALADRAFAVAREMGANPPGTFARVKRQIRGATIARIEQAMAQGGNAPEGGWFNPETRDAMRRMIG